MIRGHALASANSPKQTGRPLQVQVVFQYVGCFTLRFHTCFITWKSGRGDHCNPMPLSLDRETTQCEKTRITKRNIVLLENWFLIINQTRRMARIVCMGCPAVLLFCFVFSFFGLFILVLATLRDVPCLHISVCKLYSVN